MLASLQQRLVELAQQQQQQNRDYNSGSNNHYSAVLSSIDHHQSLVRTHLHISNPEPERNQYVVSSQRHGHERYRHYLHEENGHPARGGCEKSGVNDVTGNRRGMPDGVEIAGTVSSTNNNFEPITDQKLDTAMSLIRKTIDFVKSEYELDLVILSSFTPSSIINRHNPHHSAPPPPQHVNEASPIAGYYSSNGVAADFLHTPAGKHVISCWHQFCQGNANFPIKSSGVSLREDESQSVSLILPVPVRPMSVSPTSSVESGESLDSNENMILSSHSVRKRPKNFLVNSLMTATTKRRRASISQSETAKSSETASTMTSSSEHHVTSSSGGNFNDPVPSSSSRHLDLSSSNVNVFENSLQPDLSDGQVLDLSTTNTPTTPPPEFDNPSDAFGLLASIKEEENMISPDKLKRLRDPVVESEESKPDLDTIRLPKSGVDELISAAGRSGVDGQNTTRTRDELKNFIRTHGPIKKRSASLSSESDCYRRASFTTSSLVKDELDSQGGEPGDTSLSPSSSTLGESSMKQSAVAGTLMSSTPGSSSSVISDSDSLWSCPKCSKVMKKKCSYRHIKEVHGANRENVQCPVCYRTFTRKYTLVLHCRNVHPELEVTNATEFPTRPAEEVQREQMLKRQSRVKDESRVDSTETPDSAFSGSETSSGILSRNTGTPSEYESTSLNANPALNSSPESQLMLNKHLSLLANSPNTAQQLLGALQQEEQQLLNLLQKSPRARIEPVPTAELNTTPSPLRSQEASRNLINHGLLNPQLNSLELSLKLAQLERSQHRQLEMLATSQDM